MLKEGFSAGFLLTPVVDFKLPDTHVGHLALLSRALCL